MRNVLLLALLFVPLQAHAVDVALNLRVIEAMEPGGAHIGAYPSVGASSPTFR